MAKSHLEIAEEICEQVVQYTVNPKLYEGLISGKKFYRSANWWAMFRTRVDGKRFRSELIRTRLNGNNRNKWSEIEATSAPSGMKLGKIRELLGDTKRYEKSHKFNQVRDNWIYGVRNELQSMR